MKPRLATTGGVRLFADRLHRSKVIRLLVHHRLFMTGLVLFALIVAMAASAGVLAPHPPNQNNFRYRLGAPTGVFLLGTDGFGRDVLSRVIHGARVSLRIGLMVVVMNAILGTLIGASAGSLRSLDNVIMRVMDGLMAFPAILLAIALAATLGASELNVVLALTIAYAPRTARIVRASVLVVREQEYVQAALAAGAGYFRILFRHILANSMSPLIVQLTFIFAVSVLAEAVLSFIGVGPPPPTPTWGNVIAEAAITFGRRPGSRCSPGSRSGSRCSASTSSATASATCSIRASRWCPEQRFDRRARSPRGSADAAGRHPRRGGIVTYEGAFCGEQNEVFVDPSGGPRQTFTEDCAVCCRPNLITLSIDKDGEVELQVTQEYEV